MNARGIERGTLNLDEAKFSIPLISSFDRRYVDVDATINLIKLTRATARIFMKETITAVEAEMGPMTRGSKKRLREKMDTLVVRAKSRREKRKLQLSRLKKHN